MNKRIDANSPCICNSGKPFGTCCGVFMKSKSGTLMKVSVSSKPPFRFLAIGPTLDRFLSDDDGTILVFTSLAQANAHAEKASSETAPFAVVGISEEKYGLFIADYPKHRVVAGNVA